MKLMLILTMVILIQLLMLTQCSQLRTSPHTHRKSFTEEEHQIKPPPVLRSCFVFFLLSNDLLQHLLQAMKNTASSTTDLRLLLKVENTKRHFKEVESQVELDLLSALETEIQPEVFNIVAKVLESDGFSIGDIKNSDVRHPVDGCCVH